MISRGGIGVFVGGDAARYAGQTSTALHGGARLEAGYAVGAALVTAALFGLVFIALSHTSY